jgi:hypothetical protein
VGFLNFTQKQRWILKQVYLTLLFITTSLISNGQGSTEITLTQQRINEITTSITGKWIPDGNGSVEEIIASGSNQPNIIDTLNYQKLPFKANDHIEFRNDGTFRVNENGQFKKYTVSEKAQFYIYDGKKVYTYWIYLEKYKYYLTVENNRITLGLMYSTGGWDQPLKK